MQASYDIFEENLKWDNRKIINENDVGVYNEIAMLLELPKQFTKKFSKKLLKKFPKESFKELPKQFSEE